MTFRGIHGKIHIASLVVIYIYFEEVGIIKRRAILILAVIWVSLVCAFSSQASIRSDINNDYKVDWLDFAILAEKWLWTALPASDGMVLIPGGEFRMGDHFDEGNTDELPVHAVYVESFYMSTYMTTNRQYCDYLNDANSLDQIKVVDSVVYASGDTERNYPYCDTHTYDANSQIDYSDGFFSVRTKDEIDMSDHPMVHVSWYGAVAYCDYYGYRLPTEAQWEYAARGGHDDPYYRYPWGDSIDGSQSNYENSGDPYETAAYPWTTPVGYYDGSQTPAGTDMANAYGLYDIVGNAWEWCNDWYSSTYYSESLCLNPQGPLSGEYRVIRGGSWLYDTSFCRVAYRLGSNTPVRRVGRIGFRVVRDLE